MNERTGNILTSALLLGAVLCGATSTGRAADYDIFMNPMVTDASRPNVLFIFDNTANWSQSASSVKPEDDLLGGILVSAAGGNDSYTKFDFERAALSNFFAELAPNPGDPAKFDVGLMMFSETGAGNANPSGGYIRYAVRKMDETNARALSSLISNLDRNDDKGNAAEYALSMHEALLYHKGLVARAGMKAKTDAGEPVIVSDPSPYLPHDTGAWLITPPVYAAPEALDICGKDYVIFISNGAPDNGENNTAENLLTLLGGKHADDPIELDPSQRQQNWSDEYARYMQQLNIYTYVIDVLPTTTGQGPSNTALLKSMAARGKGRYFAVEEDGGDGSEQLQEILWKIFDEIQGVNTVFASAALPISVNVRGTTENQVYLGMFRPDERRFPRWLGNLKLYEMTVDPVTDLPYLIDANGLELQSQVTGFVVSDAVSFWTRPSDYWSFQPTGSPPSDNDYPDGEVVEKGGAAQDQRLSFGSRNIYTCIGCAAGADLTAPDQSFSSANATLTAGLLGAADNDERTAIIDWVKGADNTDPPERDADEVRPSVHGDVVHSSPAVVNYGHEVVAFYGSNDGLFRAVLGGKDTDLGGGSELWAFIAEEFLGDLKRQRNNFRLIKVPHDNPLQLLSTNRDFFFDGSAAVYRLDNNNDGSIDADEGDKVYIYLTPRRGGRFYYALDVTNPRSPSLLWKKTSADTGWGELGQAWSTPSVVKLNVAGTEKPVLIMGAGYDPGFNLLGLLHLGGDDFVPAMNATVGRGIFVADALTGNMIWQAGANPSGASRNVTVAHMNHAIPSDIAVVDLDEDGRADVGYVGDTGGRIWRLNFDDPDGHGDIANWRVSEFADMHYSGLLRDERKFLFHPDLLYIQSDCDPDAAAAGALAVLIGSGDREHPLAMTVYNVLFSLDLLHLEAPNRFYMIMDNDPQSAAVTTVTEGDLVDATDTAEVDLTSSKGWYLALAEGEKVVGSALTLNNRVFFSTSLPPPALLDTVVDLELLDENICEGNMGTALVYDVQYCNAAPIGYTSGGPIDSTERYQKIVGGGLLPSPVPVVYQVSDRETRVFVNVGLNMFDTGAAASSSNTRTFWYREKGD